MWDFVALKADISATLSPERYSHTCGVALVARMLAERLCPDLFDEVVAAAFLHDIAKEIPLTTQIELVKEAKISVTDEDLEIVPAFHAISGVAVIERDYPDYATETVLHAVRNHCVGNSNMSLADKIVYISDFIEPGRIYSESVRIREFLIGSLENIETEQLLLKLDQAILMAAESTVRHLNNGGKRVHSRTIALIQSIKNNC